MSSEPLVSVITVNRNGERYLGELLDSLQLQSYPNFEVLVVDNGSTDGSRELVRRHDPSVRLIEADGNLGFTGGNNLGFAAARGELFALINNDTVVDPDWLRRLVDEIGESPRIAAVAPKILFARPFLSVRFEVADGGGEGPALRLDEHASGFDGCDYQKPFFREGFGPSQAIGGSSWRWFGGEARVDLPIERHDRPALRLRLCAAGAEPRQLRVRVGDGPEAILEVGPEEREHRLEVSPQTLERDSFEVINNAGSFLDAEGVAGDRGIFQRDCGQFDVPEEIGAFCGCSALLRREALAEVGLFDRDYFMYFEDTELSWRLRNAGYRLHYRPDSIVRHRHAGSSGEGSPLFVFLVGRNRILMLLRHAPLRLAVRSYLGELRRFLVLLRQTRSLRSPLVRPRLRLQLSLLVLAPRALLKRYRLLAA